MGYGMDGRGSITGRGKVFPFSAASWPTQWVPGREADQSPPPSAEVNNGGAIPPLTTLSSWYSAELIS
jgi:hypothetical protein